jgi:hypothetical protein
MNVTVVIDAFRAFATAAYILHQRPGEYLLTSTSASAGRLAAADPDVLLVGKPEIGARVAYDIPNSPTRVVETRISGRRVVHRTEAGARGVLATDGIVLVAAFVNARATAAWLRRTRAHVRLWPGGSWSAGGRHPMSSAAGVEDVAGACMGCGVHRQDVDALRRRWIDSLNLPEGGCQSLSMVHRQLPMVPVEPPKYLRPHQRPVLVRLNSYGRCIRRLSS